MIFGRFSVLFGRFPSGCHDESCYTSPVILLFSWGPSFSHRLVKKPKKSEKKWLGGAFGPKMMIFEGKSPAIVPRDFMVFCRKWGKNVFFLMFLFVFLGCVFGACCAYFPYLVGSVKLFVVFFVFNLKNIGCL